MQKFSFIYPNYENNSFSSHIFNKLEFNQHQYNDKNIPKNMEDECKQKNIFKILPQQLFLRNYLSHKTPYNSLLIFHGTGSGKTLTSISVAEGLRTQMPYLRKKILVLAPASLINNYKKEIFKYFKGLYNINNINQLSLKLNTFYEIISFQRFANFIKKLSDDEIKNYYSNRVIIVDEVHNLKEIPIDINFNVFDALIKVLSLSSFNKLLLLSATPMYDNVNELKNIIKLIYTNENKSMNIKNLSFNNIDKLKNILRGYVSFLRSEHPSTFATRKYQGNLLKPLLNHTKVIDVEMSSYQFDKYFNIINSENINKDTEENQQKYRMYSNILPDDIDSSALSVELLLNKQNSISRKLGVLIKNILQKPNEKHFIFSEFKKYGAQLIYKALKKNGVSNLYLITGDLKQKEKETLIKKFNTRSTGIIIGTAVLKEGVSLSNVQHVHIFEPWFNRSKIDQIIGRALRYCSHKDLPENKRFVNIYQYISIYPNNLLNNLKLSSIENYNDIKKYTTYDVYALMIAEDKDIEIKKIERLLKEISIDCLLNIKYNIDRNNQDNSRECDYDKCIYRCDNQIEHQLDNSTMNRIFIQPYIDIVSNEIIKFISDNYIMSIQQFELLMDKLSKLYNDNNFKSKYVQQHTLMNIIPNPSIDFNNFPYIVNIKKTGQNGYLILRGKFILFQPFDNNKIFKKSMNEYKTFEERVVGDRIQKNKYTLSRYLNEFKKDKMKQLKQTKVKFTQNINLNNFGKYIGIVIKNPFTFKLLTLNEDMNIKNFKGTKYNTLKATILDDYFNNLINIYIKVNRNKANEYVDLYENASKKKLKGKIIFQLLFTMNQENVNNKKWIYVQGDEQINLNDFK